jgi:hypothetical protein
MEKFSYTFNTFGKSLKVSGDWAPCLKDICSWFALPQITEPDEPDITMEMSGADMAEIERLMPLPGTEYRIRSGIMSINRDFDYSIYSDGQMYWTDYDGAGRILLDLGRGSAVSLICGGGMLPTYQKYLFADHPLDKLLASKDIYSLHSSCASVNGKGIAFTGNSGAGKSTAAFALMQKGLPILTDEKLFIFKDAGYSAGAVSDIIKVRLDAISRFFTRPDSSHEYDVISGEHYIKLGGSKIYHWQDRVPLRALCMLEQTGEPGTEVLAINPTKLAGGLFPVTMTSVIPQHRAAKFGFIMEMLEDIECRLIRFGTDMDDFASKVEKLAETL